MSQVKNEDFISPNFLEPTIKKFEELLELIASTKEAFKTAGTEGKKLLEGIDLSNVKDLQTLNDVLEKQVKIREQVIKLDKEELKIKKEKAKLEDQLIKQEKAQLDLAAKANKVRQEEQKAILAEKKVVEQNLKLSVARRKERERQFKEREKERKQRTKQLTEYQKESRRLTELRNAYKELAIAEKENTQEAKELLKQITALDGKLKEIDKTVGQNQRNVGNYQEAVEGLKDSLKTGFTSGPLIALSAVLGALGVAFGDTREGAVELQVFFSKFTETAKVFIQSLINSSDGFKQVFKGIGTSFTNTFKKVKIEAQITAKQIQNAFTFGDASDKLEEEIKTLQASLKGLKNNDISEGIDKINKAFEGTVDTTSKAIEEQEKFLRLQLETTIEISKQEKALAGLAEQRQILQDISDDDTLSFIERAQFVEKARVAALEFAQLEQRLALTREKLTIEAIKQDLRRAQVLSESRLQQIQTGEQLQRVLQDNALARKVSDANDEAFNQAFIERRNKEVEAEAFRRDQDEKNRITARDSFEQELDIIEEFGEKRIEANQKVIDSDTASLEQRQSALLKNQQLEKQLLEESIQLIIEQGQNSIDLRSDLTETEKERRKELLASLDIQKLLSSQSETEILQLIKQNELGEIEANRLKETIKLNKDLTAATEESQKTLDETTQRTLELESEIALQRRKLSGEEIDLDNKLLENQKRNLQTRIDALEDGSLKRLELEKQLNELRLQEQEKTLEKEEENERTSLEKRQEFFEEASELFTQVIEEQTQRRIDNLDEQLSAIEQSQDALRASAERGNEEAVKSLSESEKEEARIRAERERELQRQQRIEAGLAAFKVFAANAEQDPNTALTKTFSDITTLTAFLSALPSFYEGTMDTGTVSNPLDQNGGRLAVLHNNEAVIPEIDNKKIKGAGIKSTSELAELAVSHKRSISEFRNFQSVANSPVFVSNKNDNSELISEIRELKEATKKNRPIDSSLRFDKNLDAIVYTIREGNKRIRGKKKAFWD